MAGLGYDGSIRIDTKINSDGFSKGLQKMSADMAKRVKDSEKLLDELQQKRKALSETSFVKMSELDAEKAKLESLKKAFQEIKETGDKSKISVAQTGIKEQQARVSALQAEWNKIDSEITRYDAKIAETTTNLEQQRFESQKVNDELARRRQELEDINQSAEIGNQRVVWLSRKLVELQERQNELSASGIGMGYKEFDENERAINSIKKELKEYQKTLQEVSDTKIELGGYELQRVSDDALQAKNRIIELAQEYKELISAQSVEASDDISAQIRDNLNQTAKQIQYINDLAKNNILGGLDSGAEVAEYRIDRIKQTLAELNEQRRNSNTLSDKEIANLDKKIASFERTLEVYQNNLDAANSGTGLQQISESALQAKQRLEELIEEYQTLRVKQNEGTGGDLSAQMADNLKQTAEQIKYINSLAKNNILGELANGAEVAEYRIEQIKQTLADLNEQRKNSDSLSESELSDLDKKIAAFQHTLEVYQKNLDAAKAKTGMQEESEKSNVELQGFLGTLQKIGGYLGGSFGDSLSSAASSIAAFSGQFSMIVTAAKTAYNAVKAIFSRFKEIVSNIASATSAVVKKIGNVMSKTFSTAQKGAAALGKGLAEATKGVITLAKENNALTKLTDFVGSKLERLGRMVRRVFVFSVITKGLRALRSELASYLQLNDQFSASVSRLKGVFLTAFQPIYDVVVPAVTTLINIIANAIAVISQFTAVLFGTTAKKAQQNAKSLYEQAHAVKAVGSAAKEAAKEAETAVAAFDEFNILSFPDQNGGGGGGGGAGGVEIPNFEYDYEDFPFDSWGEAFSAFLDKLLDGLPKLEAAFEKFADWLNDLAKKLYDMFTFPGVLDKVKRLGKGLADALNKLVDWIDWEMLGRALGAGLNLALNFLTSFLYGFDWMNLGRKLAEFVNGLVDEVDWYEFGRLLWAGFKIALETLAGFIMGLNMPLMAEAASNIIKGFFNEMYNTIQRIPWYGIGKQIATFLNNIDWYGSITSALKAISAAIEAVFKMVKGFINELDWSGIAKQIYTAINDSIGLIDWWEIGRTMSRAFINIFDFLIEVIKGINWHQIGENISDLILGFDFVGALSSLAMLIAESINAAVQVACGYLDKVEPELKSIAEGIANGLKEAVEAVDWKKFGEVIGRAIKGALTFVAGLLDPPLFYSIGKAIGDFLVNLDWPGIVGGLANVLANAIKSAVAAVQGFLDSVKPNLKEIATGIAEQINQFVRDVDWKEVGRTINNGLKTALNFLITLIEQINWGEIGIAIGTLISEIDWGDIFGKVCRVVIDVFFGKLLAAIIGFPSIFDIGNAIAEGLLKGIGMSMAWLLKEIWNTFIQPIIDVLFSGFEVNSPSKVTERLGKSIVEGLIKGIKETWSGILEFFQEKVNAIIDFFNGAWDGIKEKTSAAWEAIKTTLGGIWDSIKEKAVEIFEAVREKIIEAWDKLKEKTKAVWDGIKTTLSTLWDNIKSKAKEIFDGIKETISTIWDNIKAKTDEIWNNIKTFLSTLWDNLKTTAKTVFENIKTTISTIWENIKSKTTEIWNNIKTTLTTLWNELKTKVINTFNEIKNKIVEVWTTIRNEAVSKWNDIKSTIAEKINNIKQTVSEGFARVKETITSKVTEAIDALRNKDWTSVGRSIVNGIANGLNGIFDKLKNWATRVWDTVSNAFNGGGRSTASSRSVSGRSVSTFSSRVAAVPAGYQPVQLPKLANGAVIPPNQQFMAILGDQRSGLNVEAPLSTIKQAVSDAIRDMGGIGGDIHITVESVLDGRVVARNTVKHINDMTTAAGRPVLLY